MSENKFKDLSNSILAGFKTKNPEENGTDDALDESYESGGDSVSAKSVDSAKVDEGNTTNESSPDESVPLTNGSSEYEERAAVPLVRDENDSTSATSKSKKKKKAKKEVVASSVIPIDVQYKNKPKGLSSTTEFVGMSEVAEKLPPFDYSKEINKIAKIGDSSKSNSASAKHNSTFEYEDVEGYATKSSSSEGAEELQRAYDRNAELELEVAELKVNSQNYLDEIAKYKAQCKVLQGENGRLSELNNDMSSKLTDVKSHTKMDSKKLVEERDKLKEKNQALQKELQTKQDDCDRISIERTAFLERIRTLEKEKKTIEKTVQLPIENSDEKNRALCAELTVVTLQKNFETNVMERALGDAKKVVVHLDIIISKCTPEDAVAARKYQEKFKDIVGKFEVDIAKMKKEFDNQLDLIKKGARLSVLKRIEPPRPPSPPPMLELKNFPPNRVCAQPQPMPFGQNPVFSARSASEMFRPVPLFHSVGPLGQFVTPTSAYMGQFNQSCYENSNQSSNVINESGHRSSATGAIPRMPQEFPTRPTMQQSNFGLPTATTTVSMNRMMPPRLLHPDIAPPRIPMQFPTRPQTVPSAFGQNGPPPGLPVSYSFPHMQVGENYSPFSGVPLKPNVPDSKESCETRVPPVKESPAEKLIQMSPMCNMVVSERNTVAFSNAEASAEVPSAKKTVTKLQGIVDVFSERYPKATELDIKDAIAEYRNSLPNKNLKGMTMATLKAGIEPILTKKFGAPMQSISGSSTRASSVVDETSFNREHRYHLRLESEEECFICMEPKSMRSCQMLDCGHEAHKDCFDKWIPGNKTCPICRQFTLPDDEFPRLY